MSKQAASNYREATVTLLPEGGPNPLAIAAQVLANEWNIWIIQHALTGTRRFIDWKNSGDISNAALSGGLRDLTEVGIFERRLYQNRPERFEYILTRRGIATWPILLWILDWELRWSDHPPKHLSIHHSACGKPLEPVLRCKACDQAVVGRELDMIVGPSGGWDRSIPPVSTKRRAREGWVRRELPETMTLIGDRWSWAILGAAFRGVTRYSEFTQFLGGTAPTISERLKSFCDIGVLVAVPDIDRPDWSDYRLTTKGRAFLPTVLNSVEWGQSHFRSPEGKALILRHSACHKPLQLETACRACSESVRPSEIQLLNSPRPREGQSRPAHIDNEPAHLAVGTLDP